MINYNGELLSAESDFLNHKNRGVRYGDSLFETMRFIDGKIIFWEDHYLRLMASMRILRMSIPMKFTMEFLQEEIEKTIVNSGYIDKALRIRLSVFRNEGGLYLPKTSEVSYYIECSILDSPFYLLNEDPYEIELYKDFYISNDLTSTLKTNNRIVNVVGSIYAEENGYHNCLLLNGKKQVTAALNGNIFMVNDGNVTTPPIVDGCINGIIRKKLGEIILKSDVYNLKELSISPFDLQKADALFITNSVLGIAPITKYRKKTYTNTAAADLIGKLNAVVRLS